VDLSTLPVDRPAQELHAAERDATTVAPLTERHPGMGVREAYAVQRRGRELRERDGARVVGRKVGLTSAAMQQMLGVEEPDFGYLTAAMVLADGARIDRRALVAPKVEAEIAFRLRAPLQGEDVDRAAALAAIGEIAPALEVVDSRVADWRIALADTVADNASSGLAVIGAFPAPGRHGPGGDGGGARRRHPHGGAWGRRGGARPPGRGARVARAGARAVRGGHRRGGDRHPRGHGARGDRGRRRASARDVLRPRRGAGRGRGRGGDAVTVDVAALADLLHGAERDRRAVPMLTADHPDLDVAGAYAVQARNLERRVAGGDRPIGFKLGLTSRAKQLAMGVEDPLWGRLTAGLLHAEEAPLDLSLLIHARAEPEIAFLLGRDVDGATATPASVLAATEGVFPALILDSRYTDFRFTLPDVIADNASAAGVVCGGRLLAPSALDVQLEGMVLRHGGEVVDTAAGAAVSGHPAAAVAWLAHAAGSLPAGSIVLSGGLTAPVTLAPGSVVSASFTTLGTVTLRCAA